MLGCMTAALTIAFVPGVSPAKWVRVWRDRNPDVELVLQPIGADEVADALAGLADMAFARLPVEDGHHAIPLWTETAVVAMPKDSALADADQVTQEQLAATEVVDHGPVPADVDAALDLVEANVGVVVLPQSLFRAASRKELVGRPLVDAPGTRIALVWRDEDASELTDEFIGVVRGRTANSSRGQQDQPGGSSRSERADSRPSGGRSASGAAPGKGGSGKAGSGAGRSSKTGSGGSGGSGSGAGSAKGRGRGKGLGRGKPRRGQKGNR